MPIESALVTLLVVRDPVGITPTFRAVTGRMSTLYRREIALGASLIAGTVLLGAALIGDWLLRQLGITLTVFRIAGGLLLFARYPRTRFDQVTKERPMRKLLLTVAAAAAILSAPLASAQAITPVTASGIEAAVADSTVVQDVAYVCRHRPLTSRRVCWWQVGFYRHWHRRHWRWRHWHWRRWH